ncbi:hypothetical protein [Sporomusa malonica]|uniref:Uncharacterized protein n=1 Tax=Sporomusa malonica TaxID=112901 RepID=A0A1W2B594_9FIRM|nr:hypothetical protein [Sporomusa malonica]SMC67558.1 hypothetical protein SAMN04488500_106303 [Sporomusa malonica]
MIKGFAPPTRRPLPQQPIIEKKNDLTFGFKYGLMDATGCVQVIEIVPGSSAEKEGLENGYSKTNSTWRARKNGVA